MKHNQLTTNRSSTSCPRILLVDDDPDLLSLLAMRIKAARWEPITCESAEQALVEVERARPDVVVTDLRMAGMDGLALFNALKSSHPALPVIILTAHGSIPEAVTATQGGVFGFLTKPFDGKALLVDIQRALTLSGDQGHCGPATPRSATDARSGDPGDESPTGSESVWSDNFDTRSPAMMELVAQARLIARSEVSIMIDGPSGSGKEVLAQTIHSASRRHREKFVAVNCAAIPEALLESELFGHIRGAFTGATRDRAGLFTVAAEGTLLLDEVGDMPLGLQVKLLRVLQDKEIRPVGSSEVRPVNVRIIGATNRDLEQAVAHGQFREDLYYRLNVARLSLPPLNHRREDIPGLVQRQLDQLALEEHGVARRLAPAALEMLVRSDWPGNIRQLHNVVAQAYVLCTTTLIPASLISQALRKEGETFPPLVDARERFVRNYLVQILKLTDGSVARAARLAQRNRTDFYKLLNRHGIDPASFKPSRNRSTATHSDT